MNGWTVKPFWGMALHCQGKTETWGEAWNRRPQTARDETTIKAIEMNPQDRSVQESRDMPRESRECMVEQVILGIFHLTCLGVRGYTRIYAHLSEPSHLPALGQGRKMLLQPQTSWLCRIDPYFLSRISEFLLFWLLGFCSIYICKYVCVCL